MQYLLVILVGSALCALGSIKAFSQTAILNQIQEKIKQIGEAGNKVSSTIAPPQQANAKMVQSYLSRLSEPDFRFIYYRAAGTATDFCTSGVLNCLGIPSDDARAFVNVEKDLRQQKSDTEKAEETR